MGSGSSKEYYIVRKPASSKKRKERQLPKRYVPHAQGERHPNYSKSYSPSPAKGNSSRSGPNLSSHRNHKHDQGGMLNYSRPKNYEYSEERTPNHSHRDAIERKNSEKRAPNHKHDQGGMLNYSRPKNYEYSEECTPNHSHRDTIERKNSEKRAPNHSHHVTMERKYAHPSNRDRVRSPGVAGSVPTKHRVHERDMESPSSTHRANHQKHKKERLVFPNGNGRTTGDKIGRARRVVYQ